MTTTTPTAIAAELKALSRIVTVLADLDEATQKRTVAYLAERYPSAAGKLDGRAVVEALTSTAAASGLSVSELLGE